MVYVLSHSNSHTLVPLHAVQAEQKLEAHIWAVPAFRRRIYPQTSLKQMVFDFQRTFHISCMSSSFDDIYNYRLATVVQVSQCGRR